MGLNNNGEVRDSFLIANLSDSVDRLRYTYKAQEKAASRYSRYETIRKWCLISCTVFATGTFVTLLFSLAGSGYLGPLAVGFLAMLATFASFLGDVLDFSRKQMEHHEAGAKVRSIFVRAETLLSDYLAGVITESELRRMRDDIQESTDQLLLVIPRTTKKDYKKADKGISTDERTSTAQDAVHQAFQVGKPSTPAEGDTR